MNVADIPVETIEKWIDTKGVSLWAEWEVMSPARRTLAAEWMQKEVASLFSYMMSDAHARMPERSDVG